MLYHQADARKVKLFRDSRGLTQEQRSLPAGYRVKTIWKAEAGGVLKRQTLTDIATALQVELTDILINPAGLLPTRQEDANKRLVLEALQAFASHELKSLMSVVHADAEFESRAPAPIKPGGTYRGRQAVRQYFYESRSLYGIRGL